MKYFIVSDIHGNYDGLMRALAAAGYNEKDTNHILVSLGDNFDRGVQNIEVYNFLRRERVLLVKGNHEEFLIKFLENKSFFDEELYFQNGVIETIEEFAKTPIIIGETNNYATIQQKIIKSYPSLLNWLKFMVGGYVIGDYILIHAGFRGSDIYDPSLWVEDNWAKTEDFIKNFPNTNKKFIFGHWGCSQLNRKFKNSATKEMFEFKNFIGIDSGYQNDPHVYIIESDCAPKAFAQGTLFQNIV
jgi:serine/threonine protein phosphatase 1